MEKAILQICFDVFSHNNITKYSDQINRYTRKTC